MACACVQVYMPRVLAGVRVIPRVPILQNRRVLVPFLVICPCRHTPCTRLVYLCSLQELMPWRLVVNWVGLTVLSLSTSLLLLTSGGKDFTLDKDLPVFVPAQDTLLEQCRQRGYVLAD